jgi:trehalose-phosphatase
VVSEIVNRISAQHNTLSHQALVFLRQDISFAHYMALLTVADVLMVTSLREGMNLTCHEFIFCQDGKMSDNRHGPIILSEFTGSSAVFQGADISVNPWDYRKCAQAIKKALDMPPQEKEARYSKMQSIVLNQTGEMWCKSLIQSLNDAYSEHQQQDNASVPRLSVTQLSQKYRGSQRRVFFLDYEGTLASINSPNNMHLPSPQRVVDSLNEVLLDKRNIVYVMSGQMPEELDRLFQRVTGLGLIAENGCFVKKHNTEEWHGFAEKEKMSAWKESVKGIIEHYRQRVEGSRVSERHCSITFEYDAAEDQDLASKSAGECANHINDACSGMHIHAIPKEKAVLIEPTDWTKGSAAEHVFDELSQTSAPDFLFVAGNDREDEVVFRWANKLGQNETVKNVSTVSLGRRNTEATSTLTQGTSGE